jgi:hypothetical protein
LFIGVPAQTIDTIDLTLVYWLYYICIINNIKTNIMKNINLQSRIELALLGITTILIVVLFNLFANF